MGPNAIPHRYTSELTLKIKLFPVFLTLRAIVNIAIEVLQQIQAVTMAVFLRYDLYFYLSVTFP